MIRERDLHYTDRQHRDSAVKSIKKWSPANRGFYDHFRRWLRQGGYSDSALNIYGCGVRLALGWLDKPYWEIEPRADLDRVREYIRTYYASELTRQGYLKGLAKLAEFLCERLHRPRPGNVIRWETYLDPLPAGWPTTCAPTSFTTTVLASACAQAETLLTRSVARTRKTEKGT